MIPELCYIENLTNKIEFHLETKTPLTLNVLDEIGKLECYIERVNDVWCKESTKALADEIKSKLANVSPLYIFLSYCKDAESANKVSGYLDKRKMLFEWVNVFLNLSEVEMNLPSELDTVEVKETRGRKKKPFVYYVTGDEAENIKTLRNAMKEKKGKDAALIIRVAVIGGLITKPTYRAVVDEFGDIGNRSGYNRYMNENYRFTDDEIVGAKAQLNL